MYVCIASSEKVRSRSPSSKKEDRKNVSTLFADKLQEAGEEREEGKGVAGDSHSVRGIQVSAREACYRRDQPKTS